MRTLMIGLLVALGCAATAPAVEMALAAKAANRVTVAAAVRVGVNPAGPDTLITTVRWSLPSDGKGPPDSLKVNTQALTGGTLTARPAVGVVEVEFRQGIPFADSGYDITGQVCVYRRGKAACTTSTATRVMVVDVAPLAPTGVTVAPVVRVTP